MKRKSYFGVGIIGLGRILPRHIDDSIKQLKEFKLVAVCDIKKKLAKEISEKEKVPYFTDYHKLINDKNVDIVVICTPNYLHYKMALATAKKNKHCILEKPIAQSYKDAVKLVNAFKKSKGILFPVLQVRYNPAIRILKETIEKGYLGKILTASLIIRWTRPQEYFDNSDWKGTKEKDGGSLLTQAIHYIDATQNILGSVNSVFGKVSTTARKIETEDIANAIIDFESGTRANVEFTICAYPHNLECSLTVLGEKGTIKIGGNAMNKCDYWEVQNVPQPVIPDGLFPNVYAGGLYVGSCPNHKSIYENVLQVLLDNKPSFIQDTDALESLHIIDAIKKSSKLKKEIFL